MKTRTHHLCKNHKAHSSQAGLSLVEIMIAVTVTTILLMATAGTFFGNMKAVNQARSLSSATLFLETVREDLLAQSYSNLLSLNGNSFFENGDMNQSRYRADVTVFQADIGLLQVRVSLVDMQTDAEIARLVTARFERLKVLRNALLGRHRRSGFTLLELMIAGAIMSVIGIGLTQGLQLADQTNDSVQDRTGHNRELRKALKHLRPELRAARTDTMSVTTNGEGNHVLTIQVPIASAGAPAWGVYDRTLGDTPATQNRADWQLRYQVIADAFGDRILVRQILDTDGAVQQQHTMARRVLTSADSEGPGFTVQATGDVWEVRLVTKLEDSDGARTDTFHIRLRN